MQSGAGLRYVTMEEMKRSLGGEKYAVPVWKIREQRKPPYENIVVRAEIMTQYFQCQGGREGQQCPSSRWASLNG